MLSKEFSAKTVEEAIKEGLEELQLLEEQVTVEVLDEPSKGFLGISGKKARIRMTKKVSELERANDFIEGLLQLLKVNAATELTDTEDKKEINIIAVNSSALIGYRGEVLDSLQCLAGAVANTGREEYIRIVVDCENYRAKREETLKGLAQRLAEKAVRTARKVTLEPMNPFERRIIHSALADSSEVKTVSEGKEPQRFIAIIPNNMKKYGDRPERGFRRDGGKPDNRERRSGFGNRDNRNNGKESGFGGNRRDNRDRRSNSGFSGGSSGKKSSGFSGGGTFLGNSFKD